MYGATHATSAGDFGFLDSTTEVLVYDSSLNHIRIPADNLVVGGTSAGATSAVTLNATGDIDVIGTTNAYVNILATSGSDASLYLRESGTGIVGAQFVYDGGDNKLYLKVGNNTNTTRLTIDRDSGLATFANNVTVTGTLSKGSGSFKIDHPLKPETHYLVHSFVESPQANNIYRGKVVLDAGQATVNLDSVSGMTEGTFVALNRDIQCFTTNESGWTAVRGSVSGNILTIEAQSECADTISWMVIGERQDQHMYDTNWTDENGKVIVEPEK